MHPEPTLKDIPVLVVRSAVTGGHRHHEDELHRGLTEQHALVTEVGVPRPRQQWFGRSTPTDDLYHSVTAARAVATRRDTRSVIVFTTVTDALLQPASVLRRSIVRFDALSRENRAGWRGAVQRRLERRVLRLAAVLAPRSVRDLTARSDLSTLPLPSAVIPIAAKPDVAKDRPYFFLYGGKNLSKKGLDIAVEAWSEAALSDVELHVAGTDEAAGVRYLADRGITAPPSVRWLGQLDNTEFRERAAAAVAYISASRYEEFGVAQMESFVDGVPIVSVTTSGPVEIVPLLQMLAPELVAEGQAPSSLAETIAAVASWGPAQRAAYQDAIADTADDYSPEAVRHYLARAVTTAAAQGSIVLDEDGA